MPQLFKKTMQDIRRESISALQDGGVITNLSTSGVARQLIEIANQQLSEFFDAVEFHNRMGQLSTATGIFLDLIGESRGVTRNEADVATVTAADRNIRFYSVAGTPIRTLLTGNKISSGTFIKSGDDQIVFEVTRDVDVDTISTEVFVPAVATDVGAGFNVGPNILVSHNLGIDEVAVTNDLPISNGTSRESDSDYRFRISRSLDRAAGATRNAVSLAALSFPEVSQIRLREFSSGLGSFEVLVIPVGNTVSGETLAAVKAVLESVSAFGTRVEVRTPSLIGVELAIQIIFKGDTNTTERTRIRNQVKTNVLAFISSIELGNPFIYNELVQAVMQTDEKILDMKVLVYRFREEPHVLRNIVADADELFVPDPDSPAPIRIV